MSKLMEQAREMVNLSKTITERLRMKKGDDITEDETTQFKSYLLSLGVNDPVTKTTFGNGATYFEKLAEEITEVLEKPLTECGGTMTLPEAYCRINRARGVHLISPEDLLLACQKLDKINSKIT
uniref:Vacuolar protein-sorting-associated protein 36 n=1 Tax=Panagrolaimus davidi TaxID=227884 RepID=A0A914Q352_9BILA